MVNKPVIDSKTVNPDRCPVVFGLSKRRAEIDGEIEHLQSRVEKLRYDRDNIDAVLVLYGVDKPDQNITRRKTGAAGIFRPKELPRRVMEQLKANPEGIHSRDIAAAVVLDKGWDTHDERFLGAVTDKVGRVLDRLRKQERVTSSGERYATVWRRVV